MVFLELVSRVCFSSFEFVSRVCFSSLFLEFASRILLNSSLLTSNAASSRQHCQEPIYSQQCRMVNRKQTFLATSPTKTIDVPSRLAADYAADYDSVCSSFWLESQ